MFNNVYNVCLFDETTAELIVLIILRALRVEFRLSARSSEAKCLPTLHDLSPLAQ